MFTLLLVRLVKKKKMMGTQNPESAVYIRSISFSHRQQENYKEASPPCL